MGSSTRLMKNSLSGFVMRNVRRQRRLTQEDLAERVGYTSKMVGFLETGERRLGAIPTAKTQRIISCLHLNPQQLAELMGAIDADRLCKELLEVRDAIVLGAELFGKP